MFRARFGHTPERPTCHHNLQNHPPRAGLFYAKNTVHKISIYMLSYKDLKAIQEGNRRNEDVMTLLREVKRLRDLVALTYSCLGDVSIAGLGEEGIARLAPALNQMAIEPSVKEYRLAKQKREELGFRRKQALEVSHVRAARSRGDRGLA